MEVPLHGQPAAAQGLQVLGNVPGPEVLAVVACAVGGDIDGPGNQPAKALAHLHNARRADLPAQIAHRAALCRAVGGSAHRGAGVVVDPVEVAVPARDNGRVAADGEAGPAGAHGPGQTALEQLLRPGGPEAVDRVGAVLGPEGAQMEGRAHPGVLKAHLQPGLADEAVGLDVGGGQVGHDAGHVQKVPFARGPRAGEPAVVGVEVGGVEGDVLADQIPEALHHPAHVAQKAGDVVAAGKGPPVLQPQGVGEVVEGEQGTDAPVRQVLELLAVAGDGLLVKHAVLRLHPAPLHAHPAALDAQLLHQRPVLLPAAEVVHGRGRVGAVLDMSLGVPAAPAAVCRAALDPCGGRGHAQQHAGL